MRRQKYYTIAEAMEAALWCHYCGDNREADKMLRMVIGHIIRDTSGGQSRKPSPSRG
jgi:hypothetical protein